MSGEHSFVRTKSYKPTLEVETLSTTGPGGGQSPLPEPSVPVPAVELPWQAKLEPPFQCPNTQTSSLDYPDMCPLAQQRMAEGETARELEFDYLDDPGLAESDADSDSSDAEIVQGSDEEETAPPAGEIPPEGLQAQECLVNLNTGVVHICVECEETHPKAVRLLEGGTHRLLRAACSSSLAWTSGS